MARIAVIGAGMGAMAAAARLAVAGHRVAVYERGATHGGVLGSFTRDGFAFDTGPGLLHLPAVWRDFFVKTGREALEKRVRLSPVDPAAHHVFADGTHVRLPNASRAGVVAALDAALGEGAGERWSELLVRARTTWDATRRPLLEEPLRQDWTAWGRDPYPASRSRSLLGRSRRARTLAEVARRELRDPRLVALLESHALAWGLDPRDAPAAATVLPYLEESFGLWYPQGGMRALAAAVYGRCRERGVEFAFDTEVTGLLLKDGAVAGVELADGREAGAEVVVAGVDPARVASWAGGADRLWAPADRGPVADVPAAGRLTVFAALSGRRPEGTAHRTVVHAADPAAEREALFTAGRTPRPGGLTVTVLRPDDPATRPDEEHEAVTLGVAAAAGEQAGWERPERVAEAVAEVLSVAAAAVPGLPERLLWWEARTPAGHGPQQRPALAGAGGRYLLPANRTRVPGLYLVGGRSHPGGGPAHAGMSGALVAGLVVNGEDWRGSQ
ncbi:phytoene desaturase family protein [Streptomyces sp. NPDC059740]|uniref:phytoene desaturase family protein n=1 Tax=Streptomyces sp. NPDC059740 TaxID=3346926 RepID=UPI0036548008